MDFYPSYFLMTPTDAQYGVYLGLRNKTHYFALDVSYSEYLALYKRFVLRFGPYFFQHYINERPRVYSEIASGSFGTLYVVRLYDSMFAVKMEQCNEAIYTREEFKTKIQNEYKYQKRAHEMGCALRIYEYGTYEHNGDLFSFITMELLDHAIEPFLSVIQSDPSNEILQSMAYKIQALNDTLRVMGMVHGDLHWSNIMVESSPHSNELSIVLIDFGMSTDWIVDLNHYDLYSLYIATVSIANTDRVRAVMRQLMTRATGLTEQQLLFVPNVYRTYNAMRRKLLQILRIG